MKRVSLAVLFTTVCLGMMVASAQAATFQTNTQCLSCHDVTTGAGAVSRVDFDVPGVPRVGGVDLTRCAICHANQPDRYYYAGQTGLGHYHAAYPTCARCHDGSDTFALPGDTSISATLVLTPYGFFRSNASLALPPEVLHSVHSGGKWVDATLKESGCSRCHGAASCNACHDAPVGGSAHQAHGSTTFPVPLADQANGLGVVRQPLSCVRAECHSLAIAGTPAFNEPSCAGCHTDKTEVHGYDTTDHVADDAVVAGIACSACHALDLDTEHGGSACGTCHPAPRDTLAAWDQGCVTGGCHSSTSSAPFHTGVTTGHAIPATGDQCLECHEGTDLAAVHATAKDGEGGTGCLVCHSVTATPSTNDCTACHFTVETHPGGVHAAPLSTGCAGAGCHDIVDVRTTHATSPLGACAVCHDNDARVPVLPATSECANCHSYDGGVPHYADHWAAPLLVDGGVPNYAFYTGSAAGGFYTTACATCHASNLVDAHIGSAATLPQRDRFGNPLTCDSCHASSDPDVVLAIAGGLSRCDACHKNPMTGGPGAHGPINPTHASTFKASPEVPCAPCHSANIVDEHNGTQSWPDADGKQLAYCDVCHANYAGTRGQQVQDAIEVTNDVRCTACHSSTHADQGGHYATTASSAACGECHDSGQTTIDIRGLHPSCATCHENPARIADISLSTAECASCHATEGGDYHRALPSAHEYGDMPRTCLGSGCHGSNALPEAHDPYLSRYPGYDTTCALCHANTTPGRIPVGATAACDSCHVVHSDMDHTADASGECVDCHTTSDALVLHENADMGPCDVCHANPTRIAALPATVECVNCHRYSPIEENHYPATDHNAASMTRAVAAGGTASATCAQCHSGALPQAHVGPTINYGIGLSCVECHNDVLSSGAEQVAANWPTRQCDSCHTSGSAIMHNVTAAPAVPAMSSTSCASSGAGCHASSDLHALHKDASGGCALTGCHVVLDTKPVSTSCGTGGACHSTYDQNTHYVASPTHAADVSAPYTYAGKTNPCSVCHSTTLKAAHPSMPQSTCLNCHNSTDPDSVSVIKGATSWNKSCLACHDVYHGQVSATHAGQPPVGNTCLGAGCHPNNSTDLVTVHAGIANSCALSGCHDAANKDKRPTAKTCATCHPDKTDEHGDHFFTTASDFSQSTQNGCTNSGSGCHGSDSALDARFYHNGCSGCHENSSYAGYAAPNFDCSHCHDGNYSGAPDVIALTGSTPNGHYGVTPHTATQMTREVKAGGTAKAACSVCHDSSLYPAHESMSASYYGPSLSCYECHNDTRSGGNTQVLANWTTDRCDDCHTTGSKIMHSVTTAPAVTGSTTAGCTTGTGCHSSELHGLHKDATSCAVAGCHDAKNAKPTKKSCGTGGACHSGISGNHQAEHDTQGVIDTGCYGCHFRYLTEEHSALGSSCGTCHDSTATVVRNAITGGDRRCLTCHPGSAHNARQAAEFAPGNASMHRVRSDLPGMRSSFLVSGTTYTMSLPSASSFLRSGYGYDTVVKCDSCHTYSGTTGPHGATMKVNIDPAFPNPYKVVNGSESFTAQLSANSPTGMSMSKSGSSAAKIICEKCHVLRTSSGSWSNAAHKEHDDRGREGAYCNQCHVAIPHGWGRPRLLGYTTDPAAYRTWVGTSGSRDGGLARITLKSYSPTSWQKSDCGAGCSSSRHPFSGTSWPNVMTAPADPNMGSVSGKVTDQAGVAVSAAIVTIGSTTATTGSGGTFSVGNLAAGTYSVTVAKSGYTTWTGSVSVTPGANTTLNVQLQSASVATNLARAGTATASSTDSSSYAASKAIDGSTSSYWRSGSGGTQWLRVDLGTAKSVSKVVINWSGSYYARSYRVETSSDGSSWTSRYSTSSGGTSGTKTHTFAAVDARYVRVYCTSANSSDYRVNEFEVWDR